MDEKETISTNTAPETAESLAEKLRVAESMLATMQQEKEALATKQKALEEPLKAQFQKALEGAPEAVKGKFAGKTVDPVEGLKALEEETKIYNSIKAEAVKEVQSQVSEYQKTLAAKYGTRIPDISAVFVDKNEPNKTEPRVTNPGNANKSNPTVGDLASKEALTADETRKITGRLSSMAAWLKAKQNAAIAAKTN